MISACLAVLLMPVLQAPAERVRTLGHVKDRQGKAWAGADVTLVGRPVPWTDRAGKADIVRAVSDARGRLVVSLLADRSYSASAVAAITDSGPYRFSKISEDVVCGRIFTLEEASGLRRQLRVQFSGLEAWGTTAKFTARLVDSSRNLRTRELSLDKKHEVLLPAHAGDRAHLELLREGEVFQVSRLPSALVANGNADPEPLRWTYSVLPPVELHLSAQDEKGDPLPGLELRFESANYYHAPYDDSDHESQQSKPCRLRFMALGKTDASGSLLAKCPIRIVKDERKKAFVAVGSISARSDRYAERVLSLQEPDRYAHFDVGEVLPRSLSISLRVDAAQREFHGQIDKGPDKNSTDRILIERRSSMPLSKKGWASRHLPEIGIAWNEISQLGFPIAEKRAAPHVTLLLETEALRRHDLINDEAYPRNGAVTLPNALLNDHRLAALSPTLSAWDVRVVGTDGRPLAHPKILVQRIRSAGEVGSIFPMWVCGDRKGRARVILPPASYHIAFKSGDRYAIDRVTADTRVGRRQPLELRTELCAHFAGRVTGADGKGLPDVQIIPFGYTTKNAQAIDHLLTQWHQGAPLAKTGADGKFEFWFIPSERVTFHFTCQKTVNAKPVQARGFWMYGAKSVEGLEIILDVGGG